MVQAPSSPSSSMGAPLLTRALTPPAPAPRVNFSDLPTEMMRAIIDEISLRESTAEGPHVYEKTGKRCMPSIAALSVVNSQLAALCFPYLWRDVNLRNRNTADLLYLVKIIVPRHGRHIKTLDTVNYAGSHVRTIDDTYPSYILDQLGLSSRFGRPPSAAAPADIEIFGERLADLTFYGEGKDANGWAVRALVTREAVEKVQDQRAELLRLLFSPESTPKLCEFDITFDATDFQQGFHRGCLLVHIWRFKPQIKTLCVSQRLSGWHVHGEEDNPPTVLEVGPILSMFPNLTSLEITTFSAPGIPGYCSRFAKAIAGLQYLRHLRVIHRRVIHDFACIEWKGPLEKISLEPVDLNSNDFATFLNKFKESLREVFIIFEDDFTNSIPTPPMNQVIHLPLVTNFTLLGSAPSKLVRCLELASLEEISTGWTKDNTEADWLAFLARHSATLSAVYADHDGLTEAEVKSIVKFAKKNEISLLNSGMDQYWSESFGADGL